MIFLGLNVIGHSSPLWDKTEHSVKSVGHLFIYLFIYLFTFGLFALSRATPLAHGGSQVRGSIGAVAAGLHQSHSNAGSELCLQPTPQLMATPDP